MGVRATSSIVPDLDAETFRGFPICTATLRYHGQGLNAVMGWIQVVARSFDGDATVDVLPYFAGAAPFSSYGHLPTFFDAPANPDHPDGVWTATTFLTDRPGRDPHPRGRPDRRLHLGLPPGRRSSVDPRPGTPRPHQLVRPPRRTGARLPGVDLQLSSAREEGFQLSR